MGLVHHNQARGQVLGEAPMALDAGAREEACSFAAYILGEEAFLVAVDPFEIFFLVEEALVRRIFGLARPLIVVHYQFEVIGRTGRADIDVFLDFGNPVVDKVAWHKDDRRPAACRRCDSARSVVLFTGALQPAMHVLPRTLVAWLLVSTDHHEGEHLQSLAHSHVVCQQPSGNPFACLLRQQDECAHGLVVVQRRLDAGDIDLGGEIVAAEELTGASL
ncbi:uncharacterized protein PG986_014449 [Apiospora aurea]|uniref:Uncharacterized protein n=1 Tax=Apiospora aurea TaxID=335848 RepID=A0ABR1PT05_9PEZI